MVKKNQVVKKVEKPNSVTGVETKVVSVKMSTSPTELKILDSVKAIVRKLDEMEKSYSKMTQSILHVESILHVREGVSTKEFFGHGEQVETPKPIKENKMTEKEKAYIEACKNLKPIIY